MSGALRGSERLLLDWAGAHQPGPRADRIAPWRGVPPVWPPRVVAALAAERNYVSALARDLGISRALLQVHLRKLEAAGLIRADIEVSPDGRAMKFYEVTSFALHLTPETVMAAARTLGTARTMEAEV